jgi:hypothetical protein
VIARSKPMTETKRPICIAASEAFIAKLSQDEKSPPKRLSSRG